MTTKETKSELGSKDSERAKRLDDIFTQIKVISFYERYPRNGEDDICFMYNDIRSLERKLEIAKKEFIWLRQTVHQAHHDGDFYECRKNTCDAIVKVIAAIEEKE